MNRRRKLYLNTLSSIFYQMLAVISAFILPRLFLEFYGSEVNGLVSSITQFLSIIGLMELGIGAVVQSSLYSPLAQNDNLEISKIFKSAKKFFRKIIKIFVLFLIALIFIYPNFNRSFSFHYTSTLILIISINSMAQYYFGMANQLLLNADQKSFIPQTVSIIIIILNTILSVFMIRNGAQIHAVKLGASLIFLLRPLLLNYYVRKNYNINSDVELTSEPIKQKWNGVAQHVASFILNNTDIIVLTLFSSLTQVSIYSIYNLVVTGLKQLVMSLTSGMQALFGNMLANKEYEKLNKRFHQYEWFVHMLVTILFSSCAILIVPFVKVYTYGVTDGNYNQPIFGVFLTLSMAMYCIRLPYNTLVLAAGHYKETQKSAIIEVIINIFISVLTVWKYDLIGVSIGTLSAMTFRTFYLAKYLDGNIIKYKFRNFIKHIFVDLICFFILMIIHKNLTLGNISYLSWIIMAVRVFITTVVIVVLVNYAFYRIEIKSVHKSKSIA